MRQHDYFKFSVVIESKDLFMVSAMRGLAWQCQPEINRNISVAGASNEKWEKNDGKVTFYFTKPENRQTFLEQISRLFKEGWKEIARDNNKTAPPQS
jgi:hypothetical protein